MIIRPLMSKNIFLEPQDEQMHPWNKTSDNVQF